MGDKVKVRVISLENGKLSLTMKEWSEKAPRAPGDSVGEGSGGRRVRGGGSRGGGDGDDDGSNSRNRAPKIEDIWSDNTEPKWADFVASSAGVYDNVLEMTL